MMALASRASSRAVATTPRRGPSASARASAEDFFCRWRHRPRLQCCPRYLWPTRHNFRHSDAPPPLQQRRSTPTAPSDGSQSPDRARQAREPSEERRLPARWGRRGARHRRFFLKILLLKNSPFWCLCGSPHELSAHATASVTRVTRNRHR